MKNKKTIAESVVMVGNTTNGDSVAGMTICLIGTIWSPMRQVYMCDALKVNDPPHATTKGRPKRLKSSREKAKKKKGRLCRGCNGHGVSHDKRNCPALLKRGTLEIDASNPSVSGAMSESSVEGSTSNMLGSDDETITHPLKWGCWS